MKINFPYDRAQIMRMLLLAAAYYATSKFGFSLAYVAEQVTVVWPPTGIALAAVLLLGPRVWPGIFLGAFLTNATAHEPVITALGIAAGNTLEAVFGAWLLHRYAGRGPYLQRVKGVLSLVFFAAAVSTMVSATIGTISLCLGGVQPWVHFDSLWFVWWLGDAGGALIVAPLFLAWFQGTYARPSLRAGLEALALTTVTILINIALFFKPALIGGTRPHTYIIFPIIIWAAISFGQRGVTLITLILSGVAIWATSHQLGPFSDMPVGEALNVLQTFTIIICSTGLLMSAAMSERAESEKIESQIRVRLDAVLENIVDGLITIDDKGIVRSYNKACVRIFGYEAGEVIGKNIKMLMPPEHSAQHDTYIRNYLETGKAKIIGIGRELEGLRKDGIAFPMELSVAEIKVGGEERLFSGIIRDISERKRAENALQQALDRAVTYQNRLESIFDNIVDGLVTIDEKGIVKSYNKACKKIFGYEAEEVIGKNVKMLMPPEHATHHDEYLVNYLTTGKAKIIGMGRELEGLRKDGTTFPMDLSVAEVKIGRGVRLFSGIIRDIGERKIAEKNLLEYTEELKRSNQELDDFAYIASHDLKEPLRGLLTQASFLMEDYQDKIDIEGVRRLRRLTYLSQRMEKLISDLLYFSRLGRTELAIQETDPNDVVAEIGQMMDTFLKERNAHIAILHSMPRIVADKLRLAEVFRNLITNAVKYNDKPERLVEVGFIESAQAPHGREKSVFYVRDNGIGIDPEYHEAIFRIFKRLDNPTVKNEEGTGSGLTFVKKIVERHRGHIWLESEPGKGTTFYFTLGRKNT